AHTTIGCGKQGFPSAQPYLSHTPAANPGCCMFLFLSSFSSFHRKLTGPVGGQLVFFKVMPPLWKLWLWLLLMA
ncbi:hypothetical protein P174DRAFT_378975, partial [Aspergillus novofumigatus IBT 16806]